MAESLRSLARRRLAELGAAADWMERGRNGAGQALSQPPSAVGSPWNTTAPLSAALAGIAEPPTMTVAEVAAMPLADFALAGLKVRVRSKVLGEVVVFASDNAHVTEEDRRERVVYFARELAELLGVESAELRRVHLAKKLFGGTVEVS